MLQYTPRTPRALVSRALLGLTLLAGAALPAIADASIWDRICEARTLADQDHPSIETAARNYSRSAPHFERLLARGEPYLWHILEAIESRGLPVEIALLPAVESGFDPHVRSHSDAVGLWQFMRPTAERFGLRMTGWYDGRADVVASTAAALDYLEYLQDLFDDWWLSLAAYNVGEGRMQAEQRRLRQAGLRRVFWKMELPNETRGHVPRLLGLVRAVCAPERYGVSLPPMPNQASTTLITFPGQISLHRAAEWSGVAPETLYHINPAILGTTTDPGGPHHLLVPASRSEQVAARAEAADASELRSFERYRVVSGDTLSGIAYRYNTSVGEIRALNRLSSNTIRIGRELTVPSVEKRPVPSPTRNDRERLEYVVRSGDSLWTIARKHEVSVEELSRWNGLSGSDVLRLGHRLVIWVGS